MTINCPICSTELSIDNNGNYKCDFYSVASNNVHISVIKYLFGKKHWERFYFYKYNILYEYNIFVVNNININRVDIMDQESELSYSYMHLKNFPNLYSDSAIENYLLLF